MEKLDNIFNEEIIIVQKDVEHRIYLFKDSPNFSNFAKYIYNYIFKQQQENDELKKKANKIINAQQPNIYKLARLKELFKEAKE